MPRGSPPRCSQRRHGEQVDVAHAKSPSFRHSHAEPNSKCHHMPFWQPLRSPAPAMPAPMLLPRADSRSVLHSPCSLAPLPLLPTGALTIDSSALARGTAPPLTPRGRPLALPPPHPTDPSRPDEPVPRSGPVACRTARQSHVGFALRRSGRLASCERSRSLPQQRAVAWLDVLPWLWSARTPRTRRAYRHRHAGLRLAARSGGAGRRDSPSHSVARPLRQSDSFCSAA